MLIDATTERIMRKALYAAIKDDENEFEAQLEAIASGNSLVSACARATDLVALMILDKRGGRPEDGTIQELANSTALHSQWSEIDASAFVAYLRAIFAGTSMDEVLAIGDSLRTPFIQCAHLLVIWHDEDEYWYDYLDRLWETLETRQNPSSTS